MFDRFVNWLTLRDYDSEKKVAFRGIIGRYTRGNISIQQGRYLTRSDIEKLGKEGDKAAQKLRILLQTSN
ncbi:MAG: hypothetical protein ACRCU5_12335 [Rhizobiaceae bacterium]